MKYIKKFGEVNEHNFVVPTSDEIESKNKAIRALKEFKEAYINLDSYFDNERTLELVDYINEDYPFELSFGDLKVMQWVDTCVSKLQGEVDSEMMGDVDLSNGDTEIDVDKGLPPVSGNALPGGV
jgi:hypothetical protein